MVNLASLEVTYLFNVISQVKKLYPFSNWKSPVRVTPEAQCR